MSETDQIESGTAEMSLQELEEESKEQEQKMSEPEEIEPRTAETSLQEESGTAEMSLQELEEESKEQEKKMSEPEEIEPRTAETSLQEESKEQGSEEKPRPLKRSERLVSDKGKPINAALAKVIKVGDRVTWNTYHASPIAPEHQGQQGLVSYFPSRYMDRHGDGDPEQCVDVTFFNGDKYCCFMGHKGQYHLQLVE